MSSENNYQIVYGERTNSISKKKCTSLDTLKGEIKKLFYLSDQEINRADIYYIDQEGDEALISDDLMLQEDVVVDANKLVLKISKDFSPQNNEVSNEKEDEELRKNLELKKEEVVKQICEYKKKIFSLAKKIYEQKLQEKQKFYEKKRKILQEQHNEAIKKIKENSISNFQEFLQNLNKEINKTIEGELTASNQILTKNVEEKISNIKTNFSEQIQKLNFTEIKNEQDNLAALIDDTRQNFVSLTQGNQFNEVRNRLSLTNTNISKKYSYNSEDD